MPSSCYSKLVDMHLAGRHGAIGISGQGPVQVHGMLNLYLNTAVV